MPPPQRVGPPRVGKQNKLIHRFYEAFFLLCIFIQTQATHVTIIQPPHDAQTYRRRFLRNLAYVCDYTKGGSTTTAIGLAAQNDGYTFWLASNTKPKAKVMQFVGDVLELLKGLWNSKDQGDEDVERMLTERCVKFAAGRIKKEVALLLNGIEDYKECLERSKGAVDTQFLDWLGEFKSLPNHMAMCSHAYNQRHHPHLQEPEALLQTAIAPSLQGDGIRAKLSTIRHYIGRLAHHIRAVKELIHDSRFIPQVLDSYEINTVDFCTAQQLPSPDSHTTLDGIAKRLLSSNDSELQQIQQVLSSMDKHHDILKQVLGCYEKGKQQNVHAELQVLEHFYENTLSFAFEDRYISCSKPSCRCCRYYMRYHPARPVELESHQKTWSNWGIPSFPADQQHPRWLRQRDIMNRMNGDLRNDVLEKIRDQQITRAYHPDSLTEITGSLAAPVQFLSSNSSARSVSPEPVFLDHTDASSPWSNESDEFSAAVSTPRAKDSQELDILGDADKEGGALL